MTRWERVAVLVTRPVQKTYAPAHPQKTPLSMLHRLFYKALYHTPLCLHDTPFHPPHPRPVYQNVYQLYFIFSKFNTTQFYVILN